MYFVVFAAFALVLSVPQDGPPWLTVTSGVWTWALVLAQILLAGLVGGVYTRLVRHKLEHEPSWLPSAQRRLAQGNATFRIVLLIGFGVSVYLTDWVPRVRSWDFVEPIWGLDELIVLAPFFTAMIVGWIMLFPADRAVRQVALELRLWASAPARPVWRLGSYLSFMVRQHVLIIAIPMALIVVANDFVSFYGPQIRRAVGGMAWAGEAVLVVIAGIVFLFAPVMLRYVWHTRVLPAGELRDRLEKLCRRIGLTYHQILIWESDGMVVNAAVMGLLKPVRYVLLSDGLLEMMDDQKIEAVFGHEAGHVKRRHIQYYLLFAILSMLIVGGLTLLAEYCWRNYFWDISRLEIQDYLQVAAMALIILVWGLGFGVVSRRFEWEADMFGAESVTPPAEQCNQPCFVHGTAITPQPEPGRRTRPVCATAAGIFADSLQRIAALNGIPMEARSWRHSSIANRIGMLRQYGNDPTSSTRLEWTVRIIKGILAAGTVVGLAIATWLYWPF